MMPAFIPILLYHSISEQSPPGHSAFTVTPSLFREHVRVIAGSGVTAMTVGGLASCLRGKRALPARPALVTFDDGFADTGPAIELLLGAGLAASVFVTVGWIGAERMLTPHELRELAALGDRVEVGAHSIAHPHLDEIEIGRASMEISGSKSALEDMLALPIGSFAYPHGAYDRHVRMAAIDAGFSAAVAVKNALSHSEDDLYALARWTVGATTSAHQIAQLLAGRGAPLAWRGERARTRAHRLVRRVRRRIRPELAPCQ
jgi:peptidoglycan/xylan/chitin deacetylase (PgdA/CDA1 family)